MRLLILIGAINLKLVLVEIRILISDWNGGIYEVWMFASPRGSSLYSADRDHDTRSNPKETAVICEVVDTSKSVPTYL
jgi:hypothetical protein